MTRFAKMMCSSLLAATMVAATSIGHSASAAIADQEHPGQNCFYITQWHGWKSPSPNVLYLGVNYRDVYRVDLVGGSSQLRIPDVHLVSEVRGSSSICSALDLDLSVATDDGFHEPLIAKSLTKLTPAEIAAIPQKYRP